MYKKQSIQAIIRIIQVAHRFPANVCPSSRYSQSNVRSSRLFCQGHHPLVHRPHREQREVSQTGYDAIRAGRDTPAGRRAGKRRNVNLVKNDLLNFFSQKKSTALYNTHTCTHIHTHTHTHTHRYTYAHTHTHTRTQAHACTQGFTHKLRYNEACNFFCHKKANLPIIWVKKFIKQGSRTKIDRKITL